MCLTMKCESKSSAKPGAPGHDFSADIVQPPHFMAEETEIQGGGAVKMSQYQIGTGVQALWFSMLVLFRTS